MKTERHAILICCNERRFVANVEEFNSYLVEEAKFDPQRIKVVEAQPCDGNMVAEVKLFFGCLTDEKSINDVVILYAGYGEREGLKPNKNIIPYDDFGRLIHNHGRFIFINYSCYAGASIDAFKRLRLLPRKGLVLAASRRNENSLDPCFLDDILESYRNGKQFRKHVLERYLEETYQRTVIDPRMDYPMNVEYQTVTKMVHNVQHPERSGIPIDYLLFKRD